MKISLDPAMLNEEPLDAVAPAVAQAGYHYLELPNRPDFIPSFRAAQSATRDHPRFRVATR